MPGSGAPRDPRLGQGKLRVGHRLRRPMLSTRLSLCQPLALSSGPEVHLRFSIVGSQAVRCVLVVCCWVHGSHHTIALDRLVTDLDTSENRNGQGLPPNVARSDAVVLGSLLAQSGWAAKDFGCHRLTGRRWDFGWHGERPSLYRVLSGSKSLSISSATLVSAASVEVKKSKSGRPLLSWYHWMGNYQVVCGSGLFRLVCGCW